MYKLFMLALCAFVLIASPLLYAADSEDIHDLAAQSDNANTDIRAQPQLDTGPPNPKSFGRTGRTAAGTDRATNLQGNTPGRLDNGISPPGTTDRSTNRSNTDVIDNGVNANTGTSTIDPNTGLRNTTSDPNVGTGDISDRLERTNEETRQRNNRIDGSSDPATNVPRSSTSRTSTGVLRRSQTSGTNGSATGSTTGTGTGNGSSISGAGNGSDGNNAGSSGSATGTFSAPRGKR